MEGAARDPHAPRWGAWAVAHYLRADRTAFDGPQGAAEGGEGSVSRVEGDRHAAAAGRAVDQHRRAGRHLAARPPQGGPGDINLQPLYRPIVARPANEVIGMSTFNWIGSY